MKVFVLLLTALLLPHVFSLPTPRIISQYPSRDENGALLEMIAQYKQVKLKADIVEQMKNKLLAEAQIRKLEIEKSIGFTNDSTTLTSTPRPTARTASSLVAETYTILTATGSAVVFVNQATTRTVSLDRSSTVTLSSSFPNPSAVSSPMPMGSTVSSFSSASPNPVPLTSASSTSACFTSTTTFPCSAMGPVSQESAAGVASSLTMTSTSTAAKANNSSSSAPVTVLIATGSAIVLASQGLTSTMTVNIAVSSPRPTGSS